MSRVVIIDRPQKWDDLDGLSENAAKSVRFSRDVAIDVIKKLDPEHISSFADLIAKIKEALAVVKIKSHLDAMLRSTTT